MVIMEAKVKVDKAGRMVLPKEVRDELQLAPGDMLDLVSGGGLVTLRPTRRMGQMRKGRGVWVFSGGAPILAAETDRVLDAIRRGGRG